MENIKATKVKTQRETTALIAELMDLKKKATADGDTVIASRVQKQIEDALLSY